MSMGFAPTVTDSSRAIWRRGVAVMADVLRWRRFSQERAA